MLLVFVSCWSRCVRHWWWWWWCWCIMVYWLRCVGYWWYWIRWCIVLNGGENSSSFCETVGSRELSIAPLRSFNACHQLDTSIVLFSRWEIAVYYLLQTVWVSLWMSSVLVMVVVLVYHSYWLWCVGCWWYRIRWWQLLLVYLQWSFAMVCTVFSGVAKGGPGRA